MKKMSIALAIAALCGIATNTAFAQPPDGERPRDGGGFAERLKGFDKNKDGKLSKDELPERAQGIFARADKNEDGFLDEGELKQLTPPDGARPEGRPRPDGPRPAGRPRPDGPRPEGGPPFGPGGPRPPFGPPNPEQFIEMAMTFDADKDGKLDKDELRKFAEEIGRRRPGPGGPEGRPRPDGARPRPDRPDGAGPRPERPDGARPRPERPDGAGPRPERPDGERPRPERPDGERPRPERPDAE